MKTSNDYREEARQKFEESGLSYKDIGSKEIALLKKILKKELALKKYSLKMELTKPRMQTAYDPYWGCIKHCFIDVKSSYFDCRQGISFFSDNKIGFAGWADTNNVIPFTTAFCKWVSLLKKRRGVG